MDNIDDYGEQMMSSQDIPFSNNDHSAHLSTTFDISQQIASNNNIKLDKSCTHGQQTDNETFMDSLFLVFESISRTEPFLDIIFVYFMIILTVPYIYGISTDYVLIVCNFIWDFFGSKWFGDYGKTTTDQLYQPLVQVSITFVFVYFASYFVMADGLLFTSIFLYLYVVFKYRNVSFVSAALAAAMVLLDMTMRAKFYQSNHKIFTAGISAHAFTCLFYLTTKSLVDAMMSLRDYRALFDYSDRVYGEMSFSQEFTSFLHIPLVYSHLNQQYRFSEGFKDKVERPIWEKAIMYASDVFFDSTPPPPAQYTPNMVYSLPENVITFSNSTQTTDRFELCLEKVESETVWVSWTIPRSMLTALSLFPRESESNSRFPTTFIQASFQENNSGDRHYFTQIEGEFGSLTSDIRLFVNNHEYKDFDVHLPKKVVKIRNLLPDTEYKFVLSILDYSSVPISVMTKSPDIHPLTFSPDQQALQKHVTKRMELVYLIDDEKAKKKDYVSLIKKMKKEHNRHMTSLRSELDQLKRVMNKDENTQTKVVSRISAVSESIKTIEKAMESMKREIISFQELNDVIKVDLKAVDQSWQIEKEQFDQAEVLMKKQQTANDDVIRSISEELSVLTRKAGDQQEKLLALDSETREMEKIVCDLDETIKCEKKEISVIEKCIRDENKQLEKEMSESGAEQSLGDLDMEKSQLLAKLERERSEVMQLDAILMRKRETTNFGF